MSLNICISVCVPTVVVVVLVLPLVGVCCLPHPSLVSTIVFFFSVRGLFSLVQIMCASRPSYLLIVRSVPAVLCVLHIGQQFVLPVDIQHIQCPCRFFDPRETLNS